jgi:AcrR family transcriptional regulator
MPRRNEREYAERRQQIIDGALRVFAEKGFEQATNKEIAAAAGIGSPGLIYHYFKDKRDLLREVFQQRVPLFRLIARPEEMMALPPRDALTRIGRAYLESMLRDPDAEAFLRVMFSEAIRQPDFAQTLGEIGPNQIIKFLAAYCEAQMDAGLLRRADPATAACCFLGPLLLLVLARVVLRLPDAQELDRETYLAVAIETFLFGMQAED